MATPQRAQRVGLSLTEVREDRPAAASAEPVPLSDPEFKDELAAVIPHLRAFGRSLSGSRDLADDLVQETLLKAWAARKRFQAGTNMRAWTFIILRNLFLSQMRRARFKGEWDDITASKILAAPASQDRHIELGDMQRALMHLPQPQREALILVGAGGFAYEEAGPRQVIVPQGQFRDRKGDLIGLNPFTVPIGGNAMVVMNLEARVPVTRDLQVVPFYDGGNVFRSISDIFHPKPITPTGDFVTDVNAQNLRVRWSHTFGLGFRISTPREPTPATGRGGPISKLRSTTGQKTPGNNSCGRARFSRVASHPTD